MDKNIFAGIPNLPQSKELELSDRDALHRLLRGYGPTTSEMTFTNLFAWGRTNPVRVGRIDETVLFWRDAPEGGILLSPIGVLDGAGVEQALAWSQSLGGRAEFGRINEAEVEMLLAASPDLRVAEDRDSFDYVYRAEDLRKLEGRRYAGKRNQIKKFRRMTENPDFWAITDKLVPECMVMQDMWCDIKACEENPNLDAEDTAVKVVLEHWKDLDLIGGALFDGERMLGFSVAERLADDVAVIHFEKADGNIPGVYQALNQMFCEAMLSDFVWINREQDLGVEGLRQAKLSYQPAHLVKKYTVSKSE